MIKQAKSHWDSTFRAMEDDQKFCAGRQWPEDPKRAAYNDDWDNDFYVANITLQHIQKRTAALYAKNPRAIARKNARACWPRSGTARWRAWRRPKRP